MRGLFSRRRPIRTGSASLLAAYLAALLLLSLTHTCGLLRYPAGSASATLAGSSAHPTSSDDGVTTHHCLACAWERGVTAGSPQVASVAILSLISFSLPDVSSQVALDHRPLARSSRGPPCS